MLATLPMYDWPEAQKDRDQEWAGIRAALQAAGVDAPETLDRKVGYEDSWYRDDLVLGQACGRPYIHDIADTVTLIGAMDLELEHCPAGMYYSHIVVRRGTLSTMDDLSPDHRLAYNDTGSQSGFHALGDLKDARPAIKSGAHRASIQMVADGIADFAAIDAHSWKLAEAHEPKARDLTIVAQTTPTVAPAFIARKNADVSAYRHALGAAVVPKDRADYLSLH